MPAPRARALREGPKQLGAAQPSPQSTESVPWLPTPRLIRGRDVDWLVEPWAEQRAAGGGRRPRG